MIWSSQMKRHWAFSIKWNTLHHISVTSYIYLILRLKLWFHNSSPKLKNISGYYSKYYYYLFSVGTSIFICVRPATYFNLSEMWNDTDFWTSGSYSTFYSILLYHLLYDISDNEILSAGSLCNIELSNSRSSGEIFTCLKLRVSSFTKSMTKSSDVFAFVSSLEFGWKGNRLNIMLNKVTPRAWTSALNASYSPFLNCSGAM